MNTILLLLYVLVTSNPDLVLPTPEDYQKLYCQFHTHPVCENMPEEELEPEAGSKDTGMLV